VLRHDEPQSQLVVVAEVQERVEQGAELLLGLLGLLGLLLLLHGLGLPGQLLAGPCQG
jgi:hypothetical protein